MGSFYAAAEALIENDKGELLMVEEAKDHVRGTWNFPGGGWEDGESIIECVKREVLEETGFEIEVEGLLGVYKELNQRDGTETVVFSFCGRPVEKVSDELKEDVSEARFIEIEDIEDLDLRRGNRTKVLERYRNQEPEGMEMLWKDLDTLTD